MNLNIPSINIEASTEGAWKSFPLLTEIKVKIARSGNKEAVSLRKKLIQEYRDANGKGDIPEVESHKINAKIYATAIIRDWKGVKSGKKVLKYTPEYALEILIDDKHEEFYSFVIRESMTIENFRNEVRKEDEKKQ